MPKDRSMGYSATTEWKEEMLSQITKRIFNHQKRGYTIVDGTAGCGTIDIDGKIVKGSPYVLLDSISQTSLSKKDLKLCEVDKQSYKDLRKEMSLHNIKFKLGDSIKLLNKEKPNFFYYDPNGNILPYNKLEQSITNCPETDFLLYVYALPLKRHYKNNALYDFKVFIENIMKINTVYISNTNHNWFFLFIPSRESIFSKKSKFLARTCLKKINKNNKYTGGARILYKEILSISPTASSINKEFITAGLQNEILKLKDKVKQLERENKKYIKTLKKLNIVLKGV